MQTQLHVKRAVSTDTGRMFWPKKQHMIFNIRVLTFLYTIILGPMRWSWPSSPKQKSRYTTNSCLFFTSFLIGQVEYSILRVFLLVFVHQSTSLVEEAQDLNPRNRRVRHKYSEDKNNRIEIIRIKYNKFYSMNETMKLSWRRGKNTSKIVQDDKRNVGVPCHQCASSWPPRGPKYRKR